MKIIAASLGLLFFLLTFAAAQETSSQNLDIDSLFDEPQPETPKNAAPTPTVLGSLFRRSVTFGASYEFQIGIAPGWDTSPWFFDGNEAFTMGQGIKMNSSLTLDARISENFRVFTSFSYKIPGSSNITFGNFYFDYNILRTVFIRAGKYEHTWGISPNFSFTNLLLRIPETGPRGASYIFRIDAPVGIGGIQALVMTRANLMDSKIVPKFSNLGFGLKYNLAYTWADFDMGLFYQEEMATHGFLSVKTTLFNFELYNEWVIAFNSPTEEKIDFAVNLGFAKDFLDSKLTVNGEFFYNGEDKARYYKSEDANAMLPQDLRMALNVIYRSGGRGNPRFFIQMLYAPLHSSAHLTPGIRLTPLENLDIYLAVPMALGGKGGPYYKYKFNSDLNDWPFSVVLLVSFKGNFRISHNF